MTTDSSVQATTDIVDTRQRAVIYCRVSTDDKGQTNETQERECRRWCEAMDYNVVDIYKDQSTGTNLNRPGFAMMQNRIMYEGDIDFVVAYDQSRITRSDNLEMIRRTFMERRCRLLFVADSASNSDDVGSRIVRNIKTVMNEEENNIRKEKTRLGMQTRKLEGKHVGRPATFMFAEDIDVFPEGRYVPGITNTVTEADLFSYARSGFTLQYVARKIIGIPTRVLVCEMKLRDTTKPNGRTKGVKDRYTPYMQLLEASLGLPKGSLDERVGEEAVNPDERVVG